MKVVAMIPARMGSERIKFKNLRLLNGHPLISYAITAAKKSGIFSDIYINSEFEGFKQIAKEYNVNFYHRSPTLAQNHTLSDFVVNDFLENIDCDYLFWVNPTSPLQDPEDMSLGIKKITEENLDCLFPIVSKKIHALYDFNPLNFNLSQPFPRSQDLSPISHMAFSFMAWKRISYLNHFNLHNYAFLNGKIGFINISSQTAIDIDEEFDFQMAEEILRHRGSLSSPKRYHPLTNEFQGIVI